MFKNGILGFSSEKKRVAYLSTYPPRACGIATFTKDLVDSVEKLSIFKPPVLIAINNTEQSYDYDKRVKWQINPAEAESYSEVADQINTSDVDVINVQHEFGLFGGDHGENILRFLEEIDKPVVTTLHTVQEELDSQALAVLKKVVSKSTAVVVIAKVAFNILEKLNIVPKNKMVIPHGCPEIKFISSNKAKDSLGLNGRFVLTTFGLLSNGKGIEYAIQALPKVIEKEPRLAYLVIGETHPQVRKNEGECYRKKLIRLVKDLGLEKHVQFHNRFLSKRELIKYLQATDIYITPYLSASQISSGTLTYAMGAGSAVISTPYLHAKENLADNRGIFCQFRNSSSIAECMEKLLDDQVRGAMKRKNYDYSRNFTWANVAMQYAKLFDQVSMPRIVARRETIEEVELGISVCEH
jgi:polysaccharide biosynthesis protein PslF